VLFKLGVQDKRAGTSLTTLFKNISTARRYEIKYHCVLYKLRIQFTQRRFQITSSTLEKYFIKNYIQKNYIQIYGLK